MIVSLSRRKKSEESFFDDPNAKMPDDNNGRLSLLLGAFSSVRAIPQRASTDFFYFNLFP